jgi:hypothetical protein
MGWTFSSDGEDKKFVQSFGGENKPRSWGSSGCFVYDYGLDDRGSIPDRGRGFFL